MKYFEYKKEIPVEIYNEKVIVSVSNDIKVAYAKKFPSNIRENLRYAPNSNTEACVIICDHNETAEFCVMFINVNTAESGVIAHESLHVVNSILKSKGVNYYEQCEEAYTYFLGWLVAKVTEVHKTAVDKFKKK